MPKKNNNKIKYNFDRNINAQVSPRNMSLFLDLVDDVELLNIFQEVVKIGLEKKKFYFSGS